MAEVEVQTTIFQHPIRVDETEVPILRAQGLLAEATRAPAEGERRYPVTDVPDQAAKTPVTEDKPSAKETKE